MPSIAFVIFMTIQINNEDLSPFYTSNFMWQFLFARVDKKIDQFLYDNYNCWKTGVLVFMWQIKIVTYRKYFGQAQGNAVSGS